MIRTWRAARTHPTLRTVAAVSAAALLVSGCSAAGTGTKSGSATKPTAFSALFTTENTQIPAELNRLAAGECKAQNDALPLKIEQTPSSNMQQKVQLLAGQDALPVLFAGGNALINKDGALQKSGQLVDVKKALTDLGVADKLTPAASDTIDKLYGGGVYPTIPFQYNIEGIFYNKKIFEEQGIAVPATWDELLAAAAKLKAAKITPFTASGKTGWTISRWVGAYILRDLGPDALKKVADGQAKLTDPEYVRAAQAIADLGKAGYFVDGVTSVDYDTATANLLNGKAAMMYMGSWLLASINDPKKNPLGDAIGFMPVPAVTGGSGSIDQYPANVGAPTAISAKQYSPEVGGWLKCIAENYASGLMETQGAFSGFKMGKPVANVPPLTQDLQKRIDASTSTVLWFEALFNTKATGDASANAAPLLTGAMKPEQYMSLLQNDLSAAQ
ncbi:MULTISPECIES: ABC transporter substrate-binding protein [unclassified Micromonospora]|uniref:ABC transporter substrate-binding protein n=1 Tax=unclassified Micromonospora TaxID=2617518 RepID=UPI0018EA25AC|nr:MULTISPECIES: extracellular solute-binding protein [unclassified Micromonospora]MDI5938398.1 extracellular solute-binding protein [Micromonospora sp. DH15]